MRLAAIVLAAFALVGCTEERSPLDTDAAREVASWLQPEFERVAEERLGEKPPINEFFCLEGQGPGEFVCTVLLGEGGILESLGLAETSSILILHVRCGSDGSCQWRIGGPGSDASPGS